MKKSTRFALLIFVLALMTATASAESVGWKGITIKPASAQISPSGAGNSVTLKSSSASVVWEVLSGDECVTLAPNGKTCVVYGKAAGRAVIQTTSTVSGLKAKAAVKVAVKPVKSVTGLPKSMVIDQRLESYRFHATVSPASATYQDVTWAVSDNAAGTVAQSQYGVQIDQNGNMTFSSEIPQGARIYVIAMSHAGDGQTARRAVCAVTFRHVAATKIKLNRAKATITAKYRLEEQPSFRLAATVTPAADTLYDGKIAWTSSDEGICTVDDTGLVRSTGLKDGVCVISASVNGASGPLTAKCTVTVKATRVKTLTLTSLDTMAINPGESFQATASVTPSNATFPDVTWTSSDPSIATVTSDGKVTGAKLGLTTITGTADGGRKKVTISVRVRDRSKMTKVTVTVGGDIVLGGDVRSGKPSSLARFESTIKDPETGELDYTKTFRSLKPIFESDDMTLLNLECSISTRNSSSSSKPYIFVTRPQHLQILKNASIDIVSIANNHSNDTGISNTRKNLRNAGIPYVGPDMQFGQYTVKGVKIGIVGVQTPTSPARVKSLIWRCRKENDIVIFFPHFCDVKELSNKVTGTQVAQSHAAVEAGADLVVGAHPHVLSGVELYQGVNIFYDIGALVSPGKNFKKYSAVAQIDFYVDKANNYVETDTPRMYPTLTTKAMLEGGLNDCQPLLLDKSNPAHEAAYQHVVNLVTRYSKTSKIKQIAPLDWQ